MATTEQDLASFNSFVKQRMESGDASLSIDELFDQWRLENPFDKLYAENVAAIRASIEDFQNGERGTPVPTNNSVHLTLQRLTSFRKTESHVRITDLSN